MFFSQNNKIRIPKGYTSANKYKDIALIEMDNPVMFSNSVKPVCLEVDADATDENRNFTIIGYGRIDTDRSAVLFDTVVIPFYF